MVYWSIAILLAVVVLITLAAIQRRRIRTAKAVARREAIRDFDNNRSVLAAEFFHAAATSGKPRGLRWTACDITGPPLFAVDELRDELYALIAVTVSFAAVPGGGMEEVEAVGNLRSATAVFIYRGGQWSTDGRVVFNLEPYEALNHFQATLQPLQL